MFRWELVSPRGGLIMSAPYLWGVGLRRGVISPVFHLEHRPRILFYIWWYSNLKPPSCFDFSLNWRKVQTILPKPFFNETKSSCTSFTHPTPLCIERRLYYNLLARRHLQSTWPFLFSARFPILLALRRSAAPQSVAHQFKSLIQSAIYRPITQCRNPLH
jgi:hypothetical protein